MKTREFPSAQAAVAEALKFGYWPKHRRDGLIVMSNGRREYGVAVETRPRSKAYHLDERVPPDAGERTN